MMGGWRVIEKTLSPSNGLLRVFGHPTHLVNPVTVTAHLKDRTLTETVPVPAPWLVSHDFAFPDAWKDLRFDGEKVVGTVTLPNGLAGEFRWKGARRHLQSGQNLIK